MRTLTIASRMREDALRGSRVLKSSSFLNMMENPFGDSNKSNLLTDVPLLCPGYVST
jgi:hypothetical protein